VTSVFNSMCRGIGMCTVVATLSLLAPCAARADPVPAAATSDFLDTIGVVTTFPDRGQPLDKTIGMLKYGGFRWVRAGIEGLSEDGPTTLQTFLDLHRETGVKLSWGLVSGGTDIDTLTRSARVLAEAGALLAIEGNNEPNNWGVTYQGEEGGGLEHSWLPVAKLHRDLYRAVKSDPLLAKYPVWSLSEPGAQTDNVGLQFLTIPPGAGTLMPDGTAYADHANVHNYIYHPHSPHPTDNKVWDAADPSAASPVDGLWGNFGRTWRKWYKGYRADELTTLPRVTTETGVHIGGPVTEKMQALHLMNMYLAQFKRGYAHTAVYILRDRTDEANNQTYGFFAPDYSPRIAAHYLHNLTTILADDGRMDEPGRLDFAIPNQPETVHDLLLQRSDGVFQLVVWGERLRGEDEVTVDFARPQASVTVFDPTAGIHPVRKLTGVSKVDLKLSDHPLILEIRSREQD
jgi:hypothetical protein